MSEDTVTQIIRVGPKINGAVQVCRLGKELKISPKSLMHRMAPGYKVEYFDEVVEVLIGVGKDHTASLVMSVECWEAFNSGAEIHITTMNDFIGKKPKSKVNNEK